MRSLVLHILNENGDVKATLKFKSFKELTKVTPNIAYHEWRLFYKYCKNIQKEHKFLQEHENTLFKKFRIYDDTTGLENFNKSIESLINDL